MGRSKVRGNRDEVVSVEDIELQDEEAVSFVQQSIIWVLISNAVEVVVEKEKLIRKTQELNLDDQN